MVMLSYIIYGEIKEDSLTKAAENQQLGYNFLLNDIMTVVMSCEPYSVKFINPSTNLTQEVNLIAAECLQSQ